MGGKPVHLAAQPRGLLDHPLSDTRAFTESGPDPVQSATAKASQRGASGHTITAYRDTLRLLPGYAHERTGIQPADLDITVLDANLVAGFLTTLEQRRGNSTRTRNARRPHRAHPGHPRKKTRAESRQLPHRHRDRRTAGQPGPQHLDRPPRPHPPPAHGHHRRAWLSNRCVRSGVAFPTWLAMVRPLLPRQVADQGSDVLFRLPRRLHPRKNSLL